MMIRRVCLSLLTLSLAFGLDKDTPFKANRAETYPSKSTQGKMTVAVAPFDKPEDIRKAFGKADLARYKVLPVLVVIGPDGRVILTRGGGEQADLDAVAEAVAGASK